MKPISVMRARGGGALPGITGSYVGGNFAVNQNASVATLSVPAGTTIGHTLFAVLRCRGDRSFTIPSGWSSHISTILPIGSPADSSSTRIYILSKAYAGETTVSFNQSTAAAYGFALLSLKGGVIAHDFGAVPAITKLNDGSLLLAIWAFNGGTNSPTPVTTNDGSTYSLRGTTSFDVSANYYFASAVLSLMKPAGADKAASANPGDATWLAEIGS